MEGENVPEDIGAIDIPDVELPNFETIATGIENVSGGLRAICGEFERFANLQPAQQGQQIQEINQTLRLILQVLERNHVDITTRITATDNSNIQLRNRLNNLSNPTATILPLRHPRTGNFIENCPTTIAQINRLSAAEATRILDILGVRIPSTLPLKREAVRLQFL
ncbi:hypothetical protein V491_01742 [Pseudogymnoascus sp. VKM F-3775]|nr:hypothetical protein V491_01742 [Pseudogymnoascus sp. VKM F-3775]